MPLSDYTIQDINSFKAILSRIALERYEENSFDTAYLRDIVSFLDCLIEEAIV